MKPADLTKITERRTLNNDRFRKDMRKEHGVEEGFTDVEIWVDTGNYALNKRISNKFNRGIPLGKVTVFAGESGSGKSFIVSGSIVRHAQQMGIMPVLLDAEYALDKSWMEAVGVDLDPNKIMRYPVDTVSSCAATVNTFMKGYVEDYGKLPYDERPAVLFVIDSLGQLSTETDIDQFAKGELKGDMGRKPRQLKALIQQCNRLFGSQPIGLVCTNHVYKSQDMFNPDDVISGGGGPIFSASIVVSMNKLKLKEDEDGNKISEVRGIRSKMKCVKSRFAKPFEEVELKIPYETGLDPYSGLVDMFEAMGVLVKDGNKLKYVAKDGTEHKYFRKQIEDSLLDLIMAEIEADEDDGEVVGVDETPKEFRDE